ncbi:MAG TPA: pectate lyase, partial [Verrucomicrobiota bacterium]|nr:pectate lyase [Verrucomicrobiota bacterium]
MTLPSFKLPLSALVLMAGVVAMNAQVPAFPGAQGFGRFATGGRGGSVYYVTTTNDSGPGSFRDAVSQPNRTVVFAVSGVIDYKPPRYNVKNNITIAGQTAPGDGVVLYGDGIGYTDADNTITRFIRFRMGKNGTGEDTVTVARGSNMIFDHISATWSLDEVFSVSGSPDPSGITIQSSIIGQGLEEHSAGGLIQTAGGVSIVGSLYIDNGTRNPKVKGVNEFVNNVVYNWKTDAYILGDSAGDSYANVIGNYFINGPNSGSSGAFSRGNLNFHLFAADNWQDKNRNGVLDGVLLMQSDYDVNDWQASPYPYPVAPEAALPAL